MEKLESIIFGLKAEVERLQGEIAEHERQLADGELVSIEWHYEQVLSLEEEVQRLSHCLSEEQYALSICKDENERLKKHIGAKEIADEHVRKMRGTDLRTIAELQKQVDDYKRKIEKGTLIELPCKVGDTLYTNIRWQGDYMRKGSAPYPVTVVFIGINDNVDMGGGVINIVNEKGRMWQIDFLDIGKTVFLAREEAEKRLKELQG